MYPAVYVGKVEFLPINVGTVCVAYESLVPKVVIGTYHS